jgi:hypothetical protein
MYTTSNEGLLNNYAVEPRLYYATFPSPEQQGRYAVQAAIAILFVSGLILTALSVS